MYGHYAPHDSGPDANSSSAGSGSASNMTAGSGLLSNSMLERGRKECNPNAPRPMRWNTGSTNMLITSDPQTIKSSTTTKKLFTSPTNQENLDDSFIEDPMHKICETPLHGVSGANSRQGDSGGSGGSYKDSRQGDSGGSSGSYKDSRQGDSGSFTEDLQRNTNHTARSYMPRNDSRLEDSSLIRAFMPLSVNQDVSDLSNCRSRARSGSRERNTMDSGSFTAETKQDLYRLYPAQLHTTNIQQFTKNQILPQQPHTDVKPKYRPVQRRPVSHKPEARRALDHNNKENKAESDNMALGAVKKDSLKNTNLEEFLSQQSTNHDSTPQHQDLTHPSNSTQPSRFNPVTHQPEFKHSTLRQQACSRIKSAPTLAQRPSITEQQQQNQVKDVLENLDNMYRPTFTENKDNTDGLKRHKELKTPQTQNQLPAYIQNILNKGSAKPGSASSTKRDYTRSRYNSANTDTATRHDSTFPYTSAALTGHTNTAASLVAGQTNTAASLAVGHTNTAASLAAGHTNTAASLAAGHTNTAASLTKPSMTAAISEKVTDDLQLRIRSMQADAAAATSSHQKHYRQPADMSSILEPTYPSNGTDRGPAAIKTCLPGILEQSTENNQSSQQSSPDSKSRLNLFSSDPTPTHSNHSQHHTGSRGSGSRARLPATSHGSDVKEMFRTRESGTNQYDESPLLRQASNSNTNQSDHHHAMIKSKSISNVQQHSYKQSADQHTPRGVEAENMHAHTLPEPQHAHESRQTSIPDQDPNFGRPKPVPQQHYSLSEQQPRRNQQHQPPQQKQQPQICDDRTPRPMEAAARRPTEQPSSTGMRAPVEPAAASSAMPPPPASMPAPPASNSHILVINNKRYGILKVLGKGGSSKVYEAVDEHANNVVAIKQVDLRNTDEAQAAGYVNEISMLAQLQSEDRIVKLYDYENDQKREVLYVVMEKGDTDLASLLKNYAIHKEITPAMVKHYWTEMLHAVNVIHKNEIIHSDLKPANFLLVAGRLKLIDFGIASSVQSDMTSVMKDTQMGTFNFMSPEAIQDLSGPPPADKNGVHKPLIKISYKSDVWSLGCILYNLAYGKMPFGDYKLPVVKLQAILSPDHEIPFPPQNVDPLLLDVIKACLTRDVKIRPSIEELLQHPYVTGIDRSGKEACSMDMKSHMLAKLETNLQQVLSPGTFEKMKRALKDPSLAKKLVIED